MTNAEDAFGDGAGMFYEPTVTPREASNEKASLPGLTGTSGSEQEDVDSSICGDGDERDSNGSAENKIVDRSTSGKKSSRKSKSDKATGSCKDSGCNHEHGYLVEVSQVTYFADSYRSENQGKIATKCAMCSRTFVHGRPVNDDANKRAVGKSTSSVVMACNKAMTLTTRCTFAYCHVCYNQVGNEVASQEKKDGSNMRTRTRAKRPRSGGPAISNSPKKSNREPSQ
jgi:hypothetical protein